MLVSIENVIGSDNHDVLTGDAGDNLLTARNGDDELTGGDGADTIDGGDGNDTLIYSGSDAGVTVNLSNDTASGGHAAGDVISNIENIIGSAYNDVLTGNDSANILDGAEGMMSWPAAAAMIC